MIATLRVEHAFPHPPARVWRALTDPALVSRWLMPTNLAAEVGARFTLDTRQWGLTQCEVRALEPERRLEYTWVNPPLDTTVTWTLLPEGDGTRLVLEHAGFDLEDPRQRFAYEGMGGGWKGIVGDRLAGVLAADASG